MLVFKQLCVFNFSVSVRSRWFWLWYARLIYMLSWAIDLLKDKRICLTVRDWYLFWQKSLIFLLIKAIITWLLIALATTRNFKRKRFLGSRLIVLIAFDWLHLSRRHYTLHQLWKLSHIVFCWDILIDYFKQSFALNSHNGEYLKVRALFYINETL